MALRLGLAATGAGLLMTFATFLVRVNDLIGEHRWTGPANIFASLLLSAGFVGLLLAPYPRSPTALFVQLGLVLTVVAFLVVAIVKVYAKSKLPTGIASSPWESESAALASGVFSLGAIARPAEWPRRHSSVVLALIGAVILAAAGYASYARWNPNSSYALAVRGDVWAYVAGVPLTLLGAWALSRARSAVEHVAGTPKEVKSDLEANYSD